MKISTAEIKMLIKECVRCCGVYTTSDFREYVRVNSKKDVTRGQISGAISQLVDTKDIVRVGRGLYSKDMNSISSRNISSNNESGKALKSDIYTTLVKVEKELESTISSINIWELNGDNFELIAKVRELKERIEEIKIQCK